MSKTKDDTTQTSSSQTQQNPDPFTHAYDAWVKLSRDGVAHLNMLADEISKLEVRGFDWARRATKEVSDYLEESWSNATALAMEWTRLGLEATRRGVERVSSAL